MNSTGVADADGFVTALTLDIMSKYCTIATSALLVWHHVLTLDKEVSLFWRRRPSVACAIFLTNRYLCLMYSIYNIFWDPISSSYTGEGGIGCAGSISQWCIYSLQYIIWAVFSTLRVYALGQNKKSTILVLLFSLAPVITYTATLRLETFVMIPSFGCVGVVDSSWRRVYHGLFVVSRVSLVAADLIVVAVTWTTTRRHGRPDSESRRLFGRVTLLSSVLYRNGTLYFAVLTVINVLYLVTDALSLYAQGAMATAGFFEDLMYGAFSSLTAILMTRFLVDLQEAASVSVHLGSRWEQSGSCGDSIGVLRFVRADVDNWIGDGLQRLSVADGSRQQSWDEECMEMTESVQPEVDLGGAQRQEAV